MSDDKKRYYRKNVELFILLDKMKLWPARSGLLHGIKTVEEHGKYAVITTHCGKTLRVYKMCIRDRSDDSPEDLCRVIYRVE